MNKGGDKITKGLKQALEFRIHPGRQAIRISGRGDESVIISAEYYEQLKEAALRDKLSRLDDNQFRRLVERRIDAAANVLRSGLPKTIKASSAAGVSFGDGFKDVVAQAITAASLVDIDD